MPFLSVAKKCFEGTHPTEMKNMDLLIYLLYVIKAKVYWYAKWFYSWNGIITIAFLNHKILSVRPTTKFDSNFKEREGTWILLNIGNH